MLEFRYDPHPSVARFKKGKFRHHFGGRALHDGATPRGQKVPMHLLLQLDLRDPLTPIEPKDQDLTYLPLYYPLRYGHGGGSVQYAVNADDRITILSPLHKEPVDDGVEYSFSDKFPELPVTLMPLNYKQYRALTCGGSNHYRHDRAQQADHRILRELDSNRMIRLGNTFSPIQGNMGRRCENPKCEWHKKVVQTRIFAQFTDSVTPEISIFSSPGQTAYVEIYFALMTCCNTITCENQCT